MCSSDLNGDGIVTDAEWLSRPQPVKTEAQKKPRSEESPAYLTQTWYPDAGGYLPSGAQGGLVSLMGGGYLSGATDGMADNIYTTIDNTQPAALSDGEFVVAADVVSHLGNGNSGAGAEQLYAMMDEIRMDRTGTKNQGRQINPNQYMPRGVA